MTKVFIDRSVVERALEAVDAYICAQLTVGQRYTNEGQGLLDALTAIRAALEQPEQEPFSKDAEEYGQRLHDAGWAAFDAWNSLGHPPMPGHVFNDLKVLVRAAILKYLEGYTSAPTPRKPLTAEQIEREIGYRLPPHSMNALLRLVNDITGESR